MVGSIALALNSGAGAETLKEVVTYAIETNPQVVSVAKRRDAADYAIDAARGGYFPRADFLFGKGRERSQNPTTIAANPADSWVSLNRKQEALIVNQMLFDGFGVKGEVDRRAVHLHATARGLKILAKAPAPLTGLLPDALTLPLVWVGLLVNLFGGFVAIQDAVVGAVAGYLVLWLVFWGYKLLTGKDGMGYGDFKMNAAVGAFLGWKMLPLVILLSSLVGLLFGALQMFAARGKWDAGFRFHFGPYLAIAGVVAMFWGEPIVRWYLQRL